MSDATNAEKLQIRENSLVWVISTNDEEGALLDPLPDGATLIDEPVDGMDAAILFVEDRDSLIPQLDEILPQLGSTPVSWICYPKSSRSDIDHDSIRDLVGEYGWRPVGDESLDDFWSAVRLRQS